MSEPKMDGEYWITQLGRLYEQSVDAIEDGGMTASGPLSKHFNETLDQLCQHYPDNEVVQSMKHVDPTHRSSSNGMSRKVYSLEPIYDIKAKSGRLADALGYELPDLTKQHTGDLTLVRVSQNQSQEQSSEVTIETTLQLINNLTLSQEMKNDLRESVEEFNNELSSEEPDEGKLAQILSTVYEKSPEVAANLLILTLQQGFYSLLGSIGPGP